VAFPLFSVTEPPLDEREALRTIADQCPAWLDTDRRHVISCYSIYIYLETQENLSFLTTFIYIMYINIYLNMRITRYIYLNG
jgi:hypothetical protein